jgi:hypothetical protein
LTVCAFAIARASEPQPAAVAAFDRYTMLVEDQLKTRVGPHNFLWLDEHPKEKSLAWFSQDVIAPLKMLDSGKEIPVPDGLIQDWIGAIFLEGYTLERVRNVVTGFADYKNVFKQEVADSRLVKHDGDRFDAFLRIYKRQLQSVALNVNLSADFTALDPSRGYLICRSTHIGEALHANKKTEEERSPEDEYGYLWRMNLYWRLQYADNGVYAEVELISLSRDAAGNRLGRLLNGFVQSFPRDFVAAFMDGMRQAFPRIH